MNRILRENAHNGVTAADTLETTTFTVKSCKHQSAFLLNKCQRHRYQKLAPKTGTGFCRV